jgi:hypothetical protein
MSAVTFSGEHLIWCVNKFRWAWAIARKMHILRASYWLYYFYDGREVVLAYSGYFSPSSMIWYDAGDGKPPLVAITNVKMRETGRPTRRSARDGKPPLVAMTNIKMRETGMPRSSQRARRETPYRRDDKHQDARHKNTLLVVARETGNLRSSRWQATRHARREHPARRSARDGKPLLVVMRKDKTDAWDGKTPPIAARSSHETRMPHFIIKCGHREAVDLIPWESIIRTILVPLICCGFSTIYSSTSSTDEARRWPSADKARSLLHRHVPITGSDTSLLSTDEAKETHTRPC